MMFYLLTLSLSLLTLEQKIGQLIVVGFREEVEIVEQIAQGQVGGVILFTKDAPSPEKLRQLTENLQREAPIPLLIAIDQEGGLVNRLTPQNGFPETISQKELGTQNELDSTFKQGVLIAKTLRDAGINLNFSPVVDLDGGEENFISKKNRCFSSDPITVSNHALELIHGHHEYGVLTTLKHFPGHGSSTQDTHEGFVDITRSWTPNELEPFAFLIRLQAADLIMTGHIFNAHLDPNLPASLSFDTVTKLLRHKMHFGGVVITDDLQMKAIRLYFPLKTVVKLALLAGNDLLLFANTEYHDTQVAPKVIALVKELIAEGEISEERIEESFARVQALKCK